jgi:hypothetical protein
VADRPADPVCLDAVTRAELWTLVGDAIEEYGRDVGELSASGGDRLAEVHEVLAGFDFDHQLLPHDALGLVIDALRRLQPQPAHPRHFGLFDPAPTAVGVLGDALAAAFNPCLASWDASPFGVETERMLVKEFGQLFGYPIATADGIITSGGSEANLTAVMLALASRFPVARASQAAHDLPHQGSSSVVTQGGAGDRAGFRGGAGGTDRPGGPH